MKVFISSVIRGLEEEREATARAIRNLGYEPVRAEDFGASPRSPQIVCIEGVRASDAVVLIVGERYGALQDEGLSATHEEYIEARDRAPIHVFVRRKMEPEQRQQEFLAEVEGWVTGRYVARFDSPSDLEGLVVRGLHESVLAKQAASMDDAALAERARALVPERERTSSESLYLSVAGGPEQRVLRPTKLESPELAESVLREALFGEARVFSTTQGNESRVDGHALILEQDDASVRLDEIGDILIEQPATPNSGQHVMGVVEEDVLDGLRRGLAFAAAILKLIDPKERISHVALAAGLVGRVLDWRTRADLHGPYAGRIVRGVGRNGPIIVQPAPATRPRAALVQDADELAEDLMTLIRRQIL